MAGRGLGLVSRIGRLVCRHIAVQVNQTVYSSSTSYGALEVLEDAAVQSSQGFRVLLSAANPFTVRRWAKPGASRTHVGL